MYLNLKKITKGVKNVGYRANYWWPDYYSQLYVAHVTRGLGWKAIRVKDLPRMPDS